MLGSAIGAQVFFWICKEANQPIIPEWNIATKNKITVQEGATIWLVAEGKQQEYAIFADGKFTLVNE